MPFVPRGVWFMTSVLVAALLLEDSLCRQTAQKQRLVPVFYDVGVCTDKKHHTQINNLSITMDQWGASHSNADVYISKGMKSISKMVIVITRCTGGKAPSLCEYYQRWAWTKALCTFIPARAMMWSELYDSVSPPFRCPVRQGLYHMRNASMEPSAGVAMATDLPKHIWPSEVQLYDERGELVVCFVGTFEFRYVKGSG